MEVDEATARILRQYWWLIATSVVIALVLGVLVARPGDGPRFRAAARVVLAQKEPSDATEAAAVVSEARARVTSRSLASAALNQAHIDRDVNSLIRDISVHGLGTSSIVEIDVTDSDSSAVGPITQSLAEQLTQTRNEAQLGGLPTILAAIDRQIDALTIRRADIAAKLGGLPSGTEQQQLLAQQAELDREIGDFTAQHAQLATNAANIPRTEIVDPAQRIISQQSPLARHLAIAGLLGFLGGVVLAATAEMVRPTVPDARRLARLLACPLLGRVSRRDGRLFPEAGLPFSLRTAARRSGVDAVVLTAMRSDNDLTELAVRLNAALAGRPPSDTVSVEPSIRITDMTNIKEKEIVGTMQQGTRDAARTTVGPPAADLNSQCADGVAPVVSPHANAKQPVHVCNLAALTEEPILSAGLVVTHTGSVPRSRIAPVKNLLLTTGWPLLGVIETPAVRRGAEQR
ncbi:hypothetical protein [Frankia sp. CiP3]|uniref:hypothetical protein n=1 Tax=Frankia sp. CiP3 TaxID=2880971 RepID=UPI001EF6319F|nr:hypothetical protein [Frankia sp. CiP3]